MSLEKNAFEKIVEHLHDGLYFVDKDRVITYWNKAAEQISGFSAQEVVGKSCADNILTHVDRRGTCLCTGACPLADAISDGLAREAEVFLHHKEGQRIPVSVRVNPLTDETGRIIGGVELFTDISHREAGLLRIKELERMALLDALTQLANRAGIDRELAGRFKGFAEYDVSFGILFMDIDHFKKFNDTYGHDVGDKVLKFVGETLAANARAFDFYGRWGGEEFLGVIRNVGDKELEGAGQRIRALIENAYILHQDQKLGVTVSLGATMARPEDTPESLVKRADQLLYTSKRNGRNRLTMG